MGNEETAGKSKKIELFLSPEKIKEAKNSKYLLHQLSSVKKDSELQ